MARRANAIASAQGSAEPYFFLDDAPAGLLDGRVAASAELKQER
jgi:hypothetical protein